HRAAPRWRASDPRGAHTAEYTGGALVTEAFGRFARWTAHFTGTPVTFIVAAGVIVIWAVSGPIFRFSDTWQLVINTGTTIVTFLMVILIQNTQNSDSGAIQVKLDELLRSVDG